jgi:hypothetical protein
MSASSGGFKELVIRAGALLEIAVLLRFSYGGLRSLFAAEIPARDLKNDNLEIERAG